MEQHCCQPRFQPTHQRPWSGSPSSTYQLCNLELITSPLRAPFSSSCCCLLAPLHPNLKDCSLLGPLSLGFPGKNTCSGRRQGYLVGMGGGQPLKATSSPTAACRQALPPCRYSQGAGVGQGRRAEQKGLAQ